MKRLAERRITSLTKKEWMRSLMIEAVEKGYTNKTKEELMQFLEKRDEELRPIGTTSEKTNKNKLPKRLIGILL